MFAAFDDPFGCNKVVQLTSALVVFRGTCSGQCAIGTTERVPTLRFSPGLSSNRTVRIFSGNGSEHLAALHGKRSL